MREPLSGFNPRADADTGLEQKDILTGVPLQPQHAAVHVPHDRLPAQDVGPQAGVRALRHAAIRPRRWESGEEESQIEVQPTPGRTQRRLVPWGEQHRIRLTVARAVAQRQRRIIDLQTERPRLLGVAAETHAQCGAPPFHRSAKPRQNTDGRPERAVEELGLARTSESNGNIRPTLERLDGAIRYLEEAAFNECRRLRANVHANPKTKLEPDEGHLTYTAVAREIAVARHADAELAIVAGLERDAGAEGRKGVATAGAVFDRDRRNGGTDTRTPLGSDVTGGGARERDSKNHESPHAQTVRRSRSRVP